MLLSHVPHYFKSRREALLKSNPESVFIFPANSEVFRNPDVPFPFRQESNFYYLCGFEEPEAFLVLTPSQNKPGISHRTILFVRKRDPNKEIWEGERYGIEGAIKVFGADEAYLTEEFEKKLPELLSDAMKVFYRMGHNESQDRKILDALEQYRTSAGRTGRPLLSIHDPQAPLAEMRLFKSPDEIALLRKACSITAHAHKTVMQVTRAGMNEAEIEARIDCEFRINGCKRIGFNSIVACGVNATCLHYTFNNQPLKDGELILIDAGGEFEYYSGDITRTFPVGIKFTPAQSKIYNLVLKAQKECVALCKPGVKIPEIHQHACRVIAAGLLSLGLLKGSLEEILNTNAFSRFFPHRTSHWLGIDVHDVGMYLVNGEPRILEPGMALTIEPGFYAQPTDREVPEEFRQIGVRIEDDILITTTGHENLTSEVPKELEEIELLRRS